ncbi:hypothetical protein PV04_02602 [Phialophora macrospora]|uniref:Uncharacterized protein n=1 Tax=Phialophora macrospora TaxID=1851006 RepID=A0A0D2GDT5_9EURO|nr:hypothetical protein PV04_02602 [Phialophora macrospora]
MSLPVNTTSLRFQTFCDNNDLPARSSTSMDTRTGRIPDDVDTPIMTAANESRPSSSDGKLQCCCGRLECAYLENNSAILGGIERDLETAARLGQALLTRHESYVSESQQEHQRLTAYISELERERTHLQIQNGKIVEENRQLLNQLEVANSSLKDSDSHVKSLEALLRDCEVESRRLNGLSRRTEELELQILELEKERSTLSRQSDDAVEETKSTIRRWKESEAKVRRLEIELQRIEWDAKKDRERYEEIIARLERERVLERELGGAEGRLKGAAAIRGLNDKERGTNVVSHFVRDILQDNANLQAGIVELRDLLQASNEEVQNLREQILQHQPVESGDVQDLSSSVPLSEQIDWAQPSAKVQQSVHVHHHYHAKLSKRERTPTIRRTSRKRAVIGLGMLPSTPESSAPSTPVVGHQRFVSSPIIPLSLHQPQPLRNRWSVQSSATASSMVSSFPSSPRSYYEQPSSIFDRLEAGEESSRPTSPESTGFATSPLKFDGILGYAKCNPLGMEEGEPIPNHKAEDHDISPSEAEAETKSQETAHEPGSQELTPKPSQILVADDPVTDYIHSEPPDPGISNEPSPTGTDTEPLNIIVEDMPDEADEHSDVLEQAFADEQPSSLASYDGPGSGAGPSLRRTASHDSLVSISGMDIHIAKRPSSSTSQSSSLLKGNKAYFALPPSAARRMPSTQPLATVTEYTASSSVRSFSSNSLDVPSAELSPSPRSVSSSVVALSGLAGLPSSQHDGQRSSPGGFTRMVGGWVRGKWGIAPVKSNTDLRSSAASISTSSSSDSQRHGPSSSPLPSGRIPGINQKGPIPGLRPPQRITAVQISKVDEAVLKESLAE